VEAAEFEGHRGAVLADEFGIPPTGALSLLKDDALIQGPKVFKRHCASCHRYNGHDAVGQVPMKEVEESGHKTQVPEPATAADLYEFGSRKWVASVLTDYHSVFAPLANAGEKGDRFLKGEMADWAKSNAAELNKSENAESKEALIEFIVAQSERIDYGPYNPNLVATGKEIFKNGKLSSGQLTSACTDCHALKPVGEAESLGDGAGAGYPTLTGYASKAWLKEFVLNPASDSFYGADHNMMPAFHGKLRESELDHLVDWFVGDYFHAKKH
jgi:ubiquinol-cytochrome c reductase cytochrome b subunit